MVLRFLTLVLFCAVSLVSSGSFVVAQEEESEKPASSADDLAAAQVDALQGKVSDTMSSLEIEDMTHFTVLYSNYTVYSMVKAVRDDVEGAIQACAENNKDMESSLFDRFGKWDKVVGDSMVEAHDNIQNLALAHTYMPQSELKTLFGLIAATREKDSSRFETTPVTTPEACDFMMSKMDETEDSMVHMLRATLISFPALLQKNQK